MQNKDKYTTPETKVLELHFEGVIAESGSDGDTDAD